MARRYRSVWTLSFWQPAAPQRSANATSNLPPIPIPRYRRATISSLKCPTPAL
jgi:hypothetical protein